MAKKIIVNNPEKASAILKKGNIEHVLVKYPGKKPNTKGDAFLVVKNKDIDVVTTAFAEANAKTAAENNKEYRIHVYRKMSVRHYEKTALKFATGYFVPEFECECRNCGKIFEHPVKEAVWCSTSCRKEFYNNRREARKAS